MNRRDFLKASSLALLTMQSIPSFLSLARERAVGDKTLVVIQLSGGNDGLNTLVPFSNDAYYAARPTIALSKREIIPVSADLGMHPKLRSLAKFFDDGELAWIQNVGHPNPNRSHFASMAVWHTASPEASSSSGWIGRVAAQVGDPLCASNIGNSTPLAFQSETVVSPSISNVDGFELMFGEYLEGLFQKMLVGPREGQRAFIQRSMEQMLENTARVQSRLSNYQGAVDYPKTDLGYRLQQTAKLIATGLGQKVLYVSVGGFDTHVNERPTHDTLMSQLAEGLTAFQQDLEDQGLAEQVMILAFSEFGRRVAENGSEGTDHGQGGVMFALGKRVKGGIYGDLPDLEKLEDGDIKYQQDFRGIYARVLDNWLGIASQDILGANFTGPEFV
jgi:uncharacterized protein (DUF1501 family)